MSSAMNRLAASLETQLGLEEAKSEGDTTLPSSSSDSTSSGGSVVDEKSAGDRTRSSSLSSTNSSSSGLEEGKSPSPPPSFTNTSSSSGPSSPQQVYSSTMACTAPAPSASSAQQALSGLSYTAPPPSSGSSSPQQGFPTRTVPTFAALPEAVRQITWTQAFENIASVLLEEQPFDPARDPFFIVADRPSIGGASSLRSSLANAKAEAVKQQRLLAELVVKMFAANTRARSLASNLQRYENKLVQYEAALKVEKKTVFEEKTTRKRRRQEGPLANVVGGTF